jgi:hypothetical protein
MDLFVIFQRRSLPNGTFYFLESIKPEQDNLKNITIADEGSYVVT